MNLKVIATMVAACSVVSLVMAEGPEVSTSGYLDADVWADFNGKYYTNTELDLGLTVKFTDAVSAHVYATATSALSGGQIPAGYGAPDTRWLSVDFDGYDITYASPAGIFTVGDIVFQYGKFNYYIYKRLSMITGESFSRGIKYGVGNDVFTQELQVGVADIDSFTADVNGASYVTISEGQSVGVFYGIRGSSKLDFKTGSTFFAGAEYKGGIGEAVALKLDVGFRSIPGDERTSLTTILFEPALTLGKFTTALTAFIGIDDVDSVNVAAEEFGIADEMFFYVEPGYSFTDVIALGLPLEYHDPVIDMEDDASIWIVPTLYVYPASNVQWWLWGQIGIPTAEESDPFYGFGSEIIVTF
jgi:hypothetical protein